MGLAASQAKLLSITARLSDNELRSQTITAAKMSLANQTTAASRKYIDALDSTNLIYSTYDLDGNKTYVDLTGAQLSTYAPLKNQYGLINNEGQILVSELDAENYKNSANIAEFLEKYGFSNVFTFEEKLVTDEGAYNAAMEGYEEEYDTWIKNEPKQEDYGEWKTEITHNRPQPNPSDFYIQDPDWEPSVDPGDGDATVETWSLYDAFMNSTAGGCFTCSSNPRSKEYNIIQHYNHVLGHMLVGGAPDIWEGELWWTKPDGGVNGANGDGEIMNQIANALVGKTACGEPAGCSGEHEHEFYDTDVNLDCGGIACDGTQLITDKIRELMLDIEHYALVTLAYPNPKGDDNDPEWVALKQRYYHLIEHDLKGVLEDIEIPKEPEEPPMIFDQQGYDEAMEEWEKDITETEVFVPDEEAYQAAHDAWNVPPEKPDIDDFKKTITVLNYDQESEEGQWYINLWHRMNGASIYKITIDGFDNGIHDEENDGVIEGDNITSPGTGLTEDGKPLWDILEDGLMNSSEWLKYALETGIVTLERVNYANPTEMSTGLKNYEWSSIIYTNAVDISSEPDEAAIAKAEAEYESVTKDIEAKDKQYDSMLKLLDTEHSALQTEYDSVKSIISKNLERTLKMYSA